MPVWHERDRMVMRWWNWTAFTLLFNLAMVHLRHFPLPFFRLTLSLYFFGLMMEFLYLHHMPRTPCHLIWNASAVSANAPSLSTQYNLIRLFRHMHTCNRRSSWVSVLRSRAMSSGMRLINYWRGMASACWIEQDTAAACWTELSMFISMMIGVILFNFLMKRFLIFGSRKWTCDSRPRYLSTYLWG